MPTKDGTRIVKLDSPHLHVGTSYAVKDAVEHIYAIRQDSRSACSPLLKGMAGHVIPADIQGPYKLLRKNILRLMSDYSPYQRIELHPFKAQHLHDSLKELARELAGQDNFFALSLDFLIDGDARLEISRLMSFGGTKKLGYTIRPGTSPIDEQIAHISEAIDRKSVNGAPVPIVFLEDNVRARSLSMIRLAKDLLEPITKTGSAYIAGVATCFMVADNHVAEQELGMKVRPVISYELQNKNGGASVVDKLDVITVRDFALALDGYAVLLPDGQLGRMPGFLPLFNPSGIININKDSSEQFSAQVMQANKDFIKDIETRAGKTIRMGHINPHILLAMQTLMSGLDPDLPLGEVLNYISENTDQVRKRALEVEKETVYTEQVVYHPPARQSVSLEKLLGQHRFIER